MSTHTPRGRLISRYYSLANHLIPAYKFLLKKAMAEMQNGYIEIHDGTEILKLGNADSDLSAKVFVNHPDFYSRVTLGGTIGAAESYLDRNWDCDNLTNLVRILVRNREALESLDGGLSLLQAPIQKIIHRFKKNSVAGSKENIRAHYDMGNEFFQLFLDKTMMYSSAYFPKPESTLYEAQTAKLKRICDKLQLKATDHVVEIGTGWGGFAVYAAKNYGCKVTTTTISQKQYDLAVERVKEAGLEDQVTLLLKDYRDLEGSYDKLVSIEMIEAVGLDYLDTYFQTCSKLLKDNGQLLIQAITINDQFYEAAKNSVDFIQRHIFPGGALPSIQAMVNSVASHTDLRFYHMEDFTDHYARTLRSWGENLKQNELQLDKLGYEVALKRLWHYYFSYCEGGFLERSIGVVHVMWAKPQNRSQYVF